MENFILEKDIINDAKLLERLKRTISQWANAIPHHDHRDLGDNIEITEAFYRPIYNYSLKTQYESRTITEKENAGENRYQLEGLPSRKYYSLSQVPVWDMDLQTCRPFDYSENDFVVDGSQYTVTCYKCHGNKRLACPTCHGKGRKTCPDCKGRGISTCPSCGGSGNRGSCASCGGTGTQRAISGATTPCTSCNGTGKSRCRQCNGSGRSRCATCNGTGEIRCQNCGGTGRIDCPECNGLGKRIRYYQITQKFDYNNDDSTEYHNRIKRKFPNFSDSCYPEGRIIYEQSANLLSKNLLAAQPFHQNIYRTAYQKSLQRRSSSNRLLYQQFTIEQIDAFHLSYLYRGKKYAILLYQADKKSLECYEEKGPITEFRKDLLGTAKEEFENRHFIQSYDFAKMASEMDGKSRDRAVNRFLDIVTEKVSSAYRWGAVLSYLTVAYGGSFLIFKFLNKPLFVFPQLNEFYHTQWDLIKIHPLSLMLMYMIFLAFAFKNTSDYTKKWFGGNIKSFSLRFLLGFIYNLFFAGLAGGVLVLFNATGLSILFSFLLLLILRLFKLV